MSEIIQVVMHDVLRPAFTEWLESRGLELHRSPFADDPDFPTYLVAPSEALMRRTDG